MSSFASGGQRAADIQKRERIGTLLGKHHLRLLWHEIFCRYVVQIVDDKGAVVWKMKSCAIYFIRDEVLQFLENYKASDQR